MKHRTLLWCLALIVLLGGMTVWNMQRYAERVRQVEAASPETQRCLAWAEAFERWRIGPAEEAMPRQRMEDVIASSARSAGISPGPLNEELELKFTRIPLESLVLFLYELHERGELEASAVELVAPPEGVGHLSQRWASAEVRIKSSVPRAEGRLADGVTP